MKRWCIATCLGLLAAGTPASGSTFLHVGREKLAVEAAAVVVGRVLDVSSFWSQSGRIIETEAMVAVDEVLVGESPTVAIVKTFGGTVDGYTVEAHGFPTFEKGSRLVLFLERDARDTAKHRVLG